MISLSNPSDLAFIAGGYMVAFFCVTTVYLLGHYGMARLNGAGIQDFTLGFGGEIIGWTDARGTRWRLGWLPLGGFVKFAEGAPAKQGQAYFETLPVWRRAMICAAGPAVLVVFTALLLSAAAFWGGIADQEPLIGGVVRDGPAERAGLKAGDRIVEIDGATMSGWVALRRSVNAAALGTPLAVTIERNGERQELQVRPDSAVSRDGLGGKVRIQTIGAMAPSGQQARPLPPINAWSALQHGWTETAGLFRQLGTGIVSLLSGRIGFDQAGGLGTIALICGLTAKLGLAPYLQGVALFSAFNALFNMLPLPPLNGANLLLLGLEAIRRKPLGARASELVSRVGLTLLMVLFVTLLVADYRRVMALIAGT
jgi:regulator of sigma E protease